MPAAGDSRPAPRDNCPSVAAIKIAQCSGCPVDDQHHPRFGKTGCSARDAIESLREWPSPVWQPLSRYQWRVPDSDHRGVDFLNRSVGGLQNSKAAVRLSVSSRNGACALLMTTRSGRRRRQLFEARIVQLSEAGKFRDLGRIGVVIRDAHYAIERSYAIKNFGQIGRQRDNPMRNVSASGAQHQR